ncbi:MAG: peptidyl-prolyl cis-trans isomerase [Syntrophorhabdales bacterium]|jgi:peptidyl-prolyl cis-trans isomerase SurA
MRRAILSLSAAFIFLAPFVSRAEVTDRIVAIVNDEVVTLREVERFVAVEKKSRYSSMNEYTRNLQLREKLDTFIEGLLINQQAKKLRIEVVDKDVEGTIDNIKKQNLITDAELRQQLKNDNIDYKEFTEGIKRNIIRNKVLARAVMQELNLDDKVLKAYYDAHLSEYIQDEYRLQHLFISSQRKNAGERARMALSALERGVPFDQVSREFSDETTNVQEGDVGFTRKDELIPELREAVKLLIPGTYSNIIHTSFGYHILRLIEAKKADVAPFDSVKDGIRAKLFEMESDKRYKTFVAKLKSSSYIEVKI